MSTAEQGPDVIVGSETLTVLPEFTEHARTAKTDLKVVLGNLATYPDTGKIIDDSDLATGEN